MAAAAAPPPGSPGADDDQSKPPELVQQLNEARPDTVKPPTSPFVNSEPIREDQVENAVKFLSHPRVRGSPVIQRRSFLEKKGLTKEEIDQAFRRVPDLPPSSQPPSTNQDGQMKPASNVQTQVPAPVPQPAAAAPSAVVSRVGALSPSRFHWYHALLAVGFLAASGAGTAVLIKKSIIPRLKSWIRKVVLEEEDDDDDLVKKSNMKPSLAEETAAAAKAAAAAASDVAKASREMLSSRNEERKHFEDLMKLLDLQVREMKSMKNSIQTLEGHANNSVRTNFADQEDSRFSNSISKQPVANGKVGVDTRSVRSSSPPTPVEPSTAPHPRSYMEQPSNPRFAPITKPPWEVGQVGNGSNIQDVESTQAMREALEYKVQDNGVNYLSNENNSAAAVPWWQRKNPRITEIDSEMAEGKGGRSNETVIKRSTWVPPQPPPVAIPESAEAIRRPKPSTAKEAGGGKQGREELGENHDQLVSQTSDVSDELERITKVSESGVEILQTEQE